MRLFIRALGILILCAALTACGTGLSDSLTGSTKPDAAASSGVSKTKIVNICEDQKNPASGTTITNTNNCNKNNPVTTTTENPPAA